MDAIAGRPPIAGLTPYTKKNLENRPNILAVHMSEAQDSNISTDQHQSIVKKGSSYDDVVNDFSLSSVSSGCTLSTLPSRDWEQEIEEFREKMPPDLKLPYIDVLILYAEEDSTMAEEFRRHLIEEINIRHFGPVRAELYDVGLFSLEGTKLGHLDNAYNRSTYTFMLMTKNFVGNTWMTLSSESCLMDSIQSEENRWCIVPVYTVKRSGNRPFKIPMGLNALKCINYYSNDEFYRNGVAKLIGDKVYVRQENEEKLKIEQKKWIEQYKRDQISLSEKKRQTAMYEEQATRDHAEKSTASTDMPPSFPQERLEKIKDLSPEQQNLYKQKYIERVREEQHVDPSPPIQYIQKSHPRFQNPNVNETGANFQPSLNPSGQHSNEPQTENLLADSENYPSSSTSMSQGTSSYSNVGESNRMDGPYSSVNTGLERGNVPNSSLFTDCVSFPGPQSSIKGENREDGRPIIEKHIHYVTYNIVGAGQVQIGDDNKVLNTGSNTEEKSSSLGSEDDKDEKVLVDDTDSKIMTDTKSKATRFEKDRVDATKDKTDMMADKSKSQLASLKQGELAVESLPDQQQPSSGQMMDAALSSVGSNITAHMGSVSPTIMEKTQPVSVIAPSIKVEDQLTTEKLSQGMEKLLKPCGNTPNEKTSPKDKKVNLPEGRRSPISPVPMATVTPMKQGPKESEETNLKKVAETDQTCVKTYASTNTQSGVRPKGQGQQSMPLKGQSSNNQCQLLTTARPNENCDKSDSKAAKLFEHSIKPNPSTIIFNIDLLIDDETEGFKSLDACGDNQQLLEQLPSTADGSQALPSNHGGAVTMETSMPGSVNSDAEDGTPV